jgi:glyoxylase-like metal-dependent hydrolase (beta-lactamase superfamily II)
MPQSTLPALLLAAGASVCASPGAAAHALEPVDLAEGVYVFLGDTGPVSTENRGNTGNTGFIIGPSGVIVIDTGVSHLHGTRMLEAIRRRTDLPVELVILTRATQEAVFGASAFAGARLAAHRETVSLMRARCARCLEEIEPLLGAELAGTRLVIPSVEHDGSDEIRAGGTTLHVLHFGWASTPGDIAVWHPQSRTLFAGGMVSAGRVPEIRDCDFDGWRNALDRLATLPALHVVPGHGAPFSRQAIAATRTYLDALDRKVRTLYAANVGLLDALERADVPEFANWGSYGSLHRRNALHRYLQLEIEDLGGDPRSVALPQF